jgi:mxaA protein
VIGDVLTQRVPLGGPAADVASSALPAAGRVGVWLERRPSRVDTDANGRRWVVLSYQVTNAPQSLTTIELPALALSVPGGAPVRVDAWPVTIGPLTPDAIAERGDLQPMRPDRLPPRAPIARIERRVGASLAALAVVLIAWAAWWFLRNRREAARLPFARAWRDLAAANGTGDQDKTASADDDPAAWRRLHRALDETAGRVVQHDTLAPLIERAPWLAPLRDTLEQFYRQSAARFFADGEPPVAYPLRQLARELYLAERRAQR